jgi:RluA family pseudouridine synthase
VNRHRNKNGTSPLYSGAIVEVYYDEDRLLQNQPRRLENVRLDANAIRYEDEWLVVVEKPSGLPTQPTLDPNRPNLFDLMKKLISERDKVDSVYVGLHHRLDRDTSGLVLFTKKEAANKGIADLFSKHEIQKTYQCLCWRAPGTQSLNTNDTFTIQNNLGQVSTKDGKTQYGSVASGGDVAITHFRVVEAFRDVFWFEACPQTGRTHQIRVHCSGMNFPILGDELYFPEKVASMVDAPRLMLHASKLEFIHPLTQEKIDVHSTIPDEFVQVLGQLKAV